MRPSTVPENVEAEGMSPIAEDRHSATLRAVTNPSESRILIAESIELKQELLVTVGTLLHRYGTPSHRLERVMEKVSESIGLRSSFLYTPTSLMVSFDDLRPAATRMVRISAGGVDLGKLDQFDLALEGLESGRVGLRETLAIFQKIDEAPSKYPPLLVAAAWGVSSACATVFLRGGLIEVSLAFTLGLGIFAIQILLAKFSSAGRLLELITGFCAAFIALAVCLLTNQFDDRLATLGSLIVLVPGLSLTLSMTELATGHLVSGVARLAGTGVTFLGLAVGVALAWRLGNSFRPAEIESIQLPAWAFWFALGICPAAFAILFSARVRQWPVIAGVSWCGFLMAVLGAQMLGPEFGPFLGSFVVAGLSNVYARIWDRPAMVPHVPSLIILVPGSMGYQSLAMFLENDAVSAVGMAFSMVLVAAALVGGNLTANTLIPPRRVL